MITIFHTVHEQTTNIYIFKHRPRIDILFTKKKPKKKFLHQIPVIVLIAVGGIGVGSVDSVGVGSIGGVVGSVGSVDSVGVDTVVGNVGGVDVGGSVDSIGGVSSVLVLTDQASSEGLAVVLVTAIYIVNDLLCSENSPREDLIQYGLANMIQLTHLLIRARSVLPSSPDSKRVTTCQ